MLYVYTWTFTHIHSHMYALTATPYFKHGTRYVKNVSYKVKKHLLLDMFDVLLIKKTLLEALISNLFISYHVLNTRLIAFIIKQVCGIIS